MEREIDRNVPVFGHDYRRGIREMRRAVIPLRGIEFVFGSCPNEVGCRIDGGETVVSTLSSVVRITKSPWVTPK